MHWKVKRDPFLGPLAARHGEAFAYDAGFFLDEDPDDAPLDDVDWWVTPRPRRSVAGARRVVLLSTGGFCPPHAGHIAMMERAREAAEAAGLTALGGYLSPGHDAYLRMKCGDAAIPATERLQQCARLAEASDWLSVDPWEALHRKVSVNYTDVAARLRTYLRGHVDPEIEVLYVCGGDNARFALSFVDDGGCIVVGRPGAERIERELRDRLARAERILWAPGDHPAASRAIRSPVWSTPARKIVVRLEDERAVRTLGLGPELASFQRELVVLLEEHARVRTVAISCEAPRAGVLSLDPFASGEHDLAISRLFALGGYQALGHVARPGAPPLAAQLAEIPAGEYVLREDDRVTGKTLEAVLAMLPAGVRVTRSEIAIEHDADEDVADSRDFLLGADEGGLVVELPDGSIGRAPYVLPYVDPAARASVAPERVHDFSKRVWELNARLFEGTRLTVADLPAPARATFRTFARAMPLAELCRWHVARLDRIIAP
jgi:nicotinic acid mononucleotide adenylyltransferase